MVDATEGVIGIEWIEGKSVRHLLPGGTDEEGGETDDITEDEQVDPLLQYDVSQGRLD